MHRLLRTGLEHPLIGGAWPDRHHCAGNSIKPEYMDWARDAIAELHTHGAVSRWSDFVAEGKGLGARPWMAMPLIVEPKPGRPGKFRLIHDCRWPKWPEATSGASGCVGTSARACPRPLPLCSVLRWRYLDVPRVNQ